MNSEVETKQQSIYNHIGHKCNASHYRTLCLYQMKLFVLLVRYYDKVTEGPVLQVLGKIHDSLINLRTFSSFYWALIYSLAQAWRTVANHAQW